MRCINGLIPRSYHGDLSGQICIFGQDTSALTMPQISQMVGTVLQDPERQIVGSFVETEVAFGPENLGLPPDEVLTRVDESLAHLRIAHLKRRETFYVSGGEKQKVAIAGTLALRPSILLLDEPLANLDPASAQEALRLVRQLADEGRTILLIEHRVEDVLRIRPERALFLVNGEQRYFGDLEGFARAVDYGEVKLPAPLVIEKMRQRPSATPPPQLLPRCTGEGQGMGGELLVEFRDVTFAYDETPALHDICLTINSGDVIAILGPNGAGKTTLVKHAIGLLKPKRGQVVVAGKDTRQASVAQLAQTLGYVFQSPSHMLFAPTVREELAFGPHNLGHDEAHIARSVAQAVNIVHLEGLENFPPLALSFGQQKRTTIAAILAMQSRILAMDEPTAGQDYKNYMGFMDAILQLPDFAAIIFITHDLDLAISYANRVLLMNEGRIMADGPPTEVLTRRELLEQCHFVPTTLWQANVERLLQTGKFLRAEALAQV
jgi:energy-coupling factor transport system ATP-binding protein